MDSEVNYGFTRLPRGVYPKASVLQGLISLIRSETWERNSQLVVKSALDSKIESAKVVRNDSTVYDRPIHAPWDSSLLANGVRVMDRMIKDARQRYPELSYTYYQRVVKKLVTAISNCKGVETRLTHYQKLINYTRTTVSAVKDVLLSHEHWQDWVAQAEHDLPLIERMIDQAERRVVNGEKVPAEGTNWSACLCLTTTLSSRTNVRCSTATRLILAAPSSA